MVVLSAQLSPELRPRYSMVCARQRSGDGQERVPNGMKDVTILEEKAGTFLQPSGKCRFPHNRPCASWANTRYLYLITSIL